MGVLRSAKTWTRRWVGVDMKQRSCEDGERGQWPAIHPRRCSEEGAGRHRTREGGRHGGEHMEARGGLGKRMWEQHVGGGGGGGRSACNIPCAPRNEQCPLSACKADIGSQLKLLCVAAHKQPKLQYLEILNIFLNQSGRQ